MSILELKSPHDGSVLAFQVTRRDGAETEFEVSVRTPWFTGRAQASTYHNGSPTGMFSAMAREWRGWAGEKHWQDIDNQVSLSATTDATGHIGLTVELRGNTQGNLLRTILQYEAGQLEEIAEAVTALFEGTSVSI
nr:DUF6228 family protein [uncultured Albidiferax sp.]